MKKIPDNLKEDVRKFIIDNYLLGEDCLNLKDDDSFLEKGIIDSIGVIELTNFIQDRFDIRVAVAEIMPENFDTLNNLTSYIEKKLRR